MLARDGHRVTLVERDNVTVGPDAQDSTAWARKGVPHFLQPHAFIPRGRLELKQNLPDVYAALLAAGATDLDGRAKLPGEIRPEDEDLQFLAVRRPLVEWALRRAVRDEPAVDVIEGAHITGLTVEHGRAQAVQIDGSDLAVDLVVDTLGRRTPTARWAGDGVADPESSDCGVVYYSRYYRIPAGVDLPDGPWVLGPRGDLGYLGFATFPGDNGTFAVTLSVPTGSPEWHVLKDAAPFEACVASIAALRLWVGADGVEPITDVLAMAGLRNTIRHYDATSTIGLVPAGDAYCHTDPVLALGLSFALMHAAALVTALRDHADLGDVCAAYAAATRPELRERYELITAVDDQRSRLWAGEAVDFTRHDGAYALFSVVAAGAVSLVDADVFRASMRRTGLLDRTCVLDNDLDLQRRIEIGFKQMLETPRPAGPSRDDLLATAAAALD